MVGLPRLLLRVLTSGAPAQARHLTRWHPETTATAPWAVAARQRLDPGSDAQSIARRHFPDTEVLPVPQGISCPQVTSRRGCWRQRAGPRRSPPKSPYAASWNATYAKSDARAPASAGAIRA